VALLGTACGGGGDGITVSGGISGVRFVGQPAPGTAGNTFTVNVELVNSSGTRVTSATDVVTLTINGGAAISGTTSQAAVAGLATFSGLSVTRAGNDYQITASAKGFTIASSTFNISPAAPAAAQTTLLLNPSVVATNTNITAIFSFKDAFGNNLANASVSLSSSLAGSTFNPASGTTSALGTFQSTFRATAPGSANISATVNGTQITLTSPVVVTGAAADPCDPEPFTFPGSLATSLAPNGCLVDQQPTAVFRFTLASGATATGFTVNSSFVGPRLEVTTDPPGTDNIVISNVQGGTSTAGEWLLPPGIYRVRVRTTTTTGPFSLIGTNTNTTDNTGCNFRLLLVGVSMTGRALAANDCAFGDGTFYELFAIASAKPCVITMSSTVVDPYLFVTDVRTPDQAMAEDDNSGGGTTARIALDECRVQGGGPIFILANTQLGGATTGAYNLSLQITGGGSLRQNVETIDISPEIAQRMSGIGRTLMRRSPARR
jgi:hypothetical protein